jgi:hypothetical protein
MRGRSTQHSQTSQGNPLLLPRIHGRHVTPADVYVHRRGVVADALLDQPVRRRRPGLDTLPAFGLAAFLVDDPPPGTDQGVELRDGSLFGPSRPVESPQAASRWYRLLAMLGTMSKQTNIRLDEAVRAAAEERAKRRGLSLQGYVADLIEQDVNESRSAFMAGAAGFLASYAQRFEAEFGEDRYPGLPDGLAKDAPRDAA